MHPESEPVEIFIKGKERDGWIGHVGLNSAFLSIPISVCVHVPEGRGEKDFAPDKIQEQNLN